MNPIAQAFDRAADSYALHSQLQQRVGADLLGLLSPLPAPYTILDVGCATGELTARLCHQWPLAQISALDQAPAMLERAARHLTPFPRVTFHCEDIQHFHAAARYDLLTANFVLQWITNLPALMDRLQQMLAAQGYLAFSVPVEGSFAELQQAWSQLDEPIPIRPLQSAQQWLQALAPHFQVQHATELTYVEYRPQLPELLRLFKHWGANALPQRRPGLLGKHKWQRVQMAYQAFNTQQGYPLSFQVLRVLARRRVT